MVVTEIISDKLCKTYSTEGYFIRKIGTNEIYSEAVDLRVTFAVYQETDEKIPEENLG